MLSTRVFVVRNGDSESRINMTLSSAQQCPNTEASVCELEELPELISGNEFDIFHAVPAGIILMPGFHQALSSTLEHTRMDYTFCGCLSMNGGPATVVSPGDEGFNPGQFMVRRWVILELGFDGQDLKNLYRRVMTEYRGEGIPHVLCAGVPNG